MYLARRDGAFSEDDLVYSQLLSDIAGSAIENASLYTELQSTLTQYRSLIERLPAVTYLDDLDTGETQYVSPQIANLFGITPEEWKASPEAWLKAVHPDDREQARVAFDEADEKRAPSTSSTAWFHPRATCAGWWIARSSCRQSTASAPSPRA